MEEDKEKIKITCPSCNETGNYKVEPNYCAFCGFKFVNIKNQNTNITLKILGFAIGFSIGIYIVFHLFNK